MLTSPDAAHLIRVARIQSQLTQTGLAERLGCTQAAISQFESGGNLTIDTLRRIAEALGRQIQFSMV